LRWRSPFESETAFVPAARAGAGGGAGVLVSAAQAPIAPKQRPTSLTRRLTRHPSPNPSLNSPRVHFGVFDSAVMTQSRNLNDPRLHWPFEPEESRTVIPPPAKAALRSPPGKWPGHHRRQNSPARPDYWPMRRPFHRLLGLGCGPIPPRSVSRSSRRRERRIGPVRSPPAPPTSSARRASARHAERPDYRPLTQRNPRSLPAPPG